MFDEVIDFMNLFRALQHVFLVLAADHCQPGGILVVEAMGGSEDPLGSDQHAITQVPPILGVG